MAKVLADAKVNIVALLNSSGLSYTEGTLEQFELANKPGALAELAGKLAKKGINIEMIIRNLVFQAEGVKERLHPWQLTHHRRCSSCRVD